MGVNSVSISGNLTRDPELRSTRGGTQALSLGVAVSERVRDPATGEWADRPSYVDCVVFGNRAAALARILRKGAKVALHGRLRQDRWTDADGRARSRIEVVADEVDLMQRRDPAPQGAPVAAAPAAQAPRPATPAAQAPADPAADLYDEDIPF